VPYALVMSKTAPALLALLTALASGLAFASIEKKSIGVGISWAMATMTTVGCGDIVPTTAGVGAWRWS